MRPYLQIMIIFILSTHLLFAGTYGGGSGTSGNPYLISNASHLSELSSASSDWGTGIYFEQTTNITVTGEWSPIGNSTTNFRGTYDGKGYTISGVTITDQNRNGYWAFWGYTYGATIKNLGLVNISIAERSQVGGLIGYAAVTTVSNCYTTGSVGGYYGYVGGLIADTYGTSIRDCYSTASVSGGTSGSGSYTGGLVGRCTNSSPISNSYHTTGNVSGRDYVGGLVGGLESSSSVSQCYSSGSVGGTSMVGGLIGVLIANVYDSYSRANVSNSGGNSGGLIGQNRDGSTIDKCYSTGTVSGSSSVGGLLGSTTGGSTTNSFWDTESSGQGTSAGGTGKTTEQMTTQSTFLDAGWSNAIWYMDAGYNNGYPYLHWQNEGTPLPVELNSFTAKVERNSVSLTWQTSTEVDNYGFDIERGVGQTSVCQWEKIGFVQGHGNSNSVKSYSFTDKNLQSGKFLYRLKMIDTDGSFEYSSEVDAEIGLPNEYRLSQNYPNPFNPTTKIEYQLPFNSEVKIELFSITGESAATLVNQQQEAGYYTIEVNTAKLSLASGVYVYRIIANNNSNAKTYITTRKLVVLK